MRLTRLAIALLCLLAICSGSEEKSIFQLEEHAIQKLVAFSAREHASILFSPYGHIGLASNGRLTWLDEPKEGITSYSSTEAAALSKKGDRIAYCNVGRDDNSITVAIRDIAPGTERNIARWAEPHPRCFTVAWSWDDSQLAVEKGGISTINLRTGDTRQLLSSQAVVQKGMYFTGHFAWLHDGRVVVELERDVPAGKDGRTRAIFELAIIEKGELVVLTQGSWPSVSPVNDTLAYFTEQGSLSTIRADGSNKRLVSKVPNPFPFLLAESPCCPVWSPSGDRLLFYAMASEDLRDNDYLVDLHSGKRQKFLSHTSIAVHDWR